MDQLATLLVFDSSKIDKKSISDCAKRVLGPKNLFKMNKTYKNWKIRLIVGEVSDPLGDPKNQTQKSKMVEETPSRRQKKM